MVWNKKKETEQQTALSPQEKRQLRRRRQRRRAIIRAVVLVVICVALVLLWKNWDSLSADRVAGALDEMTGTGTGSYPVDLSGLHVRRLDRAQDHTVLLTESHLVYLNHNGAEVNRYPCTYANPLLRTAGRYALLAEQGGKRLMLLTRHRIVTQLDVGKNIISVSVNEKGEMAVLSDGPQGYAVQIRVYNKNGKLLYTRSRNLTGTEVALSRDGHQVAMLSVTATDGELTTLMEVFSLKSTDPEALCTYTGKDTLLYRMEYLTGNWLVAVSDTSAVMLDTRDGLATVYAPDGMRLLGYAVGEGDVALVLRAYGSTGGGEIHIVDKTGTPKKTVPFTGDFRHLSEANHQYMLLTDTAAQRLTHKGVVSAAEVEMDAQLAVLDGDQAVVLGLNRLDAYKLKTVKESK